MLALSFLARIGQLASHQSMSLRNTKYSLLVV